MSTNRPLLLESNPVRLARLHTGLRRAGINAIAVAHIAEVERWPSDTFVITDIDRLTPWWSEVGATGVIVLANTAEQGVAACRRGATTWLPRNCTVGKLVAAIRAKLPPRKAGFFAAPAKVGPKLADCTRVRIIRQLAGIVDGVSLSALLPGLTYDLDAGLARYLVSSGAAEENASTRPVTAVPADDPYIAHLTGGIVVSYVNPPRLKGVAADNPGKSLRRVRKHKRG